MTISAIVPCFNEEKSVKNVVDTLLACPEIKEVIVVNDGSVDNSLAILRSFGQKIKLINFKKNHGKSNAVAAGIKKAEGDLVLMLDADLIGLKTSHIKKMIRVFINKKPDVLLLNLCMKNNPSTELFYYRLLDKVKEKLIKYNFLSGQRIYSRASLLPLVPKIKKLGYALEVFLNNEFKNGKTEIINFPEIRHLPKEIKSKTFFQAFKLYFKEAMEISKELARQKGIKGKEALAFRNRFIHEFLNKYARYGKKWQKILKKYLDEVLKVN